MPRPGQTIPAPFPVGGLNDGAAEASQPGDTFDADGALNVRAFGAQRRFRGGKRPGTTRHFSTQVTAGVSQESVEQISFFGFPKGTGGTPIEPTPPISTFDGLTTPDEIQANSLVQIAQYVGHNDVNLDQGSGSGNALGTNTVAGRQIEAQTSLDWQGPQHLDVSLGTTKVQVWTKDTGPSTTTDTENMFFAGVLTAQDANQDVTATFRVGEEVSGTVPGASSVPYQEAETYEMTNLAVGLRISADGKSGIFAVVRPSSVGAPNVFVMKVIRLWYHEGSATHFYNVLEPAFDDTETSFDYTDISVDNNDWTLHKDVTMSMRELAKERKIEVTLTIGTGFTNQPVARTDSATNTTLGTIRYVVDYGAVEDDAGTDWNDNPVVPATDTLVGAGVMQNIVSKKRLSSMLFSPNVAVPSPAADDGETAFAGDGMVAAWSRSASGVSRAYFGKLSDRLVGTDLTQATNAADGSADTAGHEDHKAIVVQPAFKKFYSVDGRTSRILDPFDGKVRTWTSTFGTFPDGCRVAGLYRGRMVLANQSGPGAPATPEPSAVFMSRVLDPHDWEVGATGTGRAVEGTAAAAVALGATDIGVPADTITAVIPFSDDYLYLGALNSLWLLAGDPGFQAILNPVDAKGVNIVGPRAWTFAEQNIIYFLASNGLWRINPGSRVPEHVSTTKMTNIFRSVDWTATRAHLSYDKTQKIVHVFLTPFTLPGDLTTIRHYVYDTASDSFWPDSYPFAPLCSVGIDIGAEEDGRTVLMGDDDGRILRYEHRVANDDAVETRAGDVFSFDASNRGSAITSFVRLPWIRTAAGERRAKIVEVQCEGVLDVPVAGPTLGSNLTIEGYSGLTPRDVDGKRDSTPGDTSDFRFGCAPNTLAIHRVRARGNAVQMVVSHATEGERWSLEEVRAHVTDGGRVRE